MFNQNRVMTLEKLDHEVKRMYPELDVFNLPTGLKAVLYYVKKMQQRELSEEWLAFFETLEACQLSAADDTLDILQNNQLLREHLNSLEEALEQGISLDEIEREYYAKSP